MKKSLIKTISLLLIIGLNWVGLSRISETWANFSDIEISEGNIFSAGILDFSLFSGQNNFVPSRKALNLKPGDEVNRVIQVRNEGSLPFQYTGQTKKIFGDDDFCNALKLKANLEGKKIYEGNLMDFNFLPIEISNSGIDTWHFKVSLPKDSNFKNKICQIKFIFDSWQINSLGFFDQEEIESYFASASLNPDEENMDEGNVTEIGEEETTDGSPEETPPEDTSEEEITEEPVDETIEDDFEENTTTIDETAEEETQNDDSNETDDSSIEEEPLVIEDSVTSSTANSSGDG